MSTDRELLDAAARAAGMEIGSWVDSWMDQPGVVGYWLDGDNWNPLTDDGDALRLAVKMNLEIYTNDRHNLACATDGHLASAHEDHDQDKGAAVRRAIVICAGRLQGDDPSRGGMGS